MAQEHSPPAASSFEAGISWTLPAIVVVAATCLVGALVSASGSAPVVWIAIGGACTVAAVAEAALRGRSATAHRAQVAELLTALRRQEAETIRLADVLLPEVIDRLRRGEYPDDVLNSLVGNAGHTSRWSADTSMTPQFKTALRTVLARVVDAVDAEENLRESAQRAFVNIARRVQAIVHQQAQEMREMEDRHGSDPDVFGDLLRLDHGTALVGRLADSISVLGGARPGRQWSRAVPLYSVLRGAMSRIIDYQRVELHSVSEVAVVGPAVEPLIHALAELLDNATRYSPPHTRVHLTAVEVQSGIAVEIEDGGVNMSEEARKRAERMLAQAQTGIDLNDLGETPRLGLAVVGRLAQAYGFQISLRSSAYGGVRAVLIVPQDLITTTSAATGLAHGIGASSGPRAVAPSPRQHPVDHLSAQTSAPLPPAAARPVPPARPGRGDDTVPVTERTPTGLPQRRRKDREVAPDAPYGFSSRTPTEEAAPGMWLEAFHNGLSGTSGGEDDGPGPANKGT
ncbi:ATP-binding protein [Streptomyces sp. NPDC001553]|uniref:sensor histidine kinase n=1 Tax=Streptomyces sp. NPDC001553 TaxID=3154385 RepID=UPI003325DDF3